jgi:hypothetical protein
MSVVADRVRLPSLPRADLSDKWHIHCPGIRFVFPRELKSIDSLDVCQLF